MKFEKTTRDDPYYKACVAGTTVIGAAVGMFGGSLAVPGAGTLAGAAGAGLIGFGIGYFACPYLAPAIKKKIQGNVKLSEEELFSAVEAMKTYSGTRGDLEAIKLVALVKSIPSETSENLVCGNPNKVAKNLLSMT